MFKKIDLTKVKLIIWDLDETFWKGTLSERTQVVIEKNVKLIKKLSERGIINSICSKNEISAVKKEFSKQEYQNIFDFFIFPSVDWSAKGQRIKHLISKMQLRPQNVLFIDDNIGNLQEAKYYNPDLLVSTPDIIQLLEKRVLSLGKDDRNLSRLNQYKILEKKHQAKEQASSNKDFLRESQIKISIFSDCISQKERILELINRSNQMNYTKIRLTEDELLYILQNKSIENAYITAKDKYGDYGIIGFYSLDIKSNKLNHFVFSCRILGMGIDQYCYQKLKFPSLDVVGEISSHVVPKKTVDWITIDEQLSVRSNNSPKEYQPKVLFKGPCDLESVLPYLQGISIETEFIHPNNNEPGTVAQQCLNHIVQAHKFSKEKCCNIIQKTPVLSSYDFTTKLFSERYEYVFLSTLLEGEIALYRHKKEGYFVSYGLTDYEFTNPQNWKLLLDKNFPYSGGVHFTTEMLKKLSEDFEYMGLPSEQNVLDNIIYIRKNLPSSTKLVLILGCEIDCIKNTIPGYKNSSVCYKKNNKLLKEKLKGYDNIEFIEISDCIESQSDFIDCVNHYTRQVYYKLALKINKILSKDVSLNFKLVMTYKKQREKLRKKYLKNNLKKNCFFWKRKKYQEKLHNLKKQIEALSELINFLEKETN